jgi:hypothetical protein
MPFYLAEYSEKVLTTFKKPNIITYYILTSRRVCTYPKYYPKYGQSMLVDFAFEEEYLVPEV